MGLIYGPMSPSRTRRRVQNCRYYVNILLFQTADLGVRGANPLGRAKFLPCRATGASEFEES